jgi:hypothetical protein
MKAGFVLILVSLFAPFLHAQEDLYTALGKGDVPGIASYLGADVELALNDVEQVLSKPEAEIRLRDFYKENPAKSFHVVHTGASKSNESNYIIGDLTTEKGKFRVYFYFTQEGDKRVIAELRIDKE